MGVSLGYCTTASVPQKVQDSIYAEAEHLEPTQGWWAESFHFFDSGEDDGRLYGQTKTDLVGYSTALGQYVEVDITDNDLMAFRDICFILETLAGWSTKYGLAWEVEHAGELIGMIENGQWDSQLRAYVG